MRGSKNLFQKRTGVDVVVCLPLEQHQDICVKPLIVAKAIIIKLYHGLEAIQFGTFPTSAYYDCYKIVQGSNDENKMTQQKKNIRSVSVAAVT